MIRKYLAIAALCLASTMAFATVAMADPAPDICVLDISQPVTIDHAINAADMSCATKAILDVAEAVPIQGGDDEDEAAGTAKLKFAALDYAGPRLHFDPGRIIV